MTMDREVQLTPHKFDAYTEGERKCWGLKEISAALGVSPDTARRFANDETCDAPIYRPGGRYFAFRSDLMEWLRS